MLVSHFSSTVLSVVMLSVVMLHVIILNVVAPASFNTSKITLAKLFIGHHAFGQQSCKTNLFFVLTNSFLDFPFREDALTLLNV